MREMHFDQRALTDAAVAWTLAGVCAVLILSPRLWVSVDLCIQWLCKNITANPPVSFLFYTGLYTLYFIFNDIF